MKILKSNNDYKFLFQIMESQLNYIAEKEEPWKNLSKTYYGIHSYLREAISKTIMFDIHPQLILDQNQTDEVVKRLLDIHQNDLLEAMKNVRNGKFLVASALVAFEATFDPTFQEITQLNIEFSPVITWVC